MYTEIDVPNELIGVQYFYYNTLSFKKSLKRKGRCSAKKCRNFELKVSAELNHYLKKRYNQERN
jgi:hypothetical protein